MGYVLGYSGIDGSLARHAERHPGLDARRSHLVQGLDSAAALVRDGVVVAAAAEERFTLVKGTGEFPVNAIRHCLRQAGIGVADLDAVAHSFAYRIDQEIAELDPEAAAQVAFHGPERQSELWNAHFDQLPGGAVVAVPHHTAHARSAVELSGFPDALVLVSDGMGEHESMTIFHAAGGELTPLRTVAADHSLGVLYSLLTYHLGFLPCMDEYKVMGLASFGDPAVHRAAFADLVRLDDRGGYTIPVLTGETDRAGAETHEAALATLVRMFGAARQSRDPLLQAHRDLAAALQERVEQAVLHSVRWAVASTGERRLCLAGGVALNCTANGRIAASGLVDDLFVQPASGDDGAALGAALAVHRDRGGDRGPRMAMPYWGSAYSDDDLAEAAAQADGWVAEQFDHVPDLAATVATDLASGAVIAWFQGGMEFGPRALGNRSILADPRAASTRDKVNRLIKKREDFRPFAPAAKCESSAKYFDLEPGTEHWYAHMVVLTRTRPEHAASLAAVTHVNGTARVQTVERDANPRFWALLDAMEREIGLPVVLNTSFNVQGQPIVRTPEQAIATLTTAGLDGLVLGRTYLRRAVPGEQGR